MGQGGPERVGPSPPAQDTAPANARAESQAESVEYSKGFQWKVKEKSAQANITAFQAVYKRVGSTIKTTNEAKRLNIAADTLEPVLLVRTVPRLDSTAYLYARITVPKTASPILAGQVSLFRDGVFAGTDRFPQLAPGEEHELGLGADDRVKVKRVVLEHKSGETFTTSYLDERRYAIVIKNLHTRPVQPQVIDRTLVATQRDIKVDFTVDKGPQPSAKDVNDRRGTYLWQLQAEPDEEKQIGFSYRACGKAAVVPRAERGGVAEQSADGTVIIDRGTEGYGVSAVPLFIIHIQGQPRGIFYTERV